MVGLLKRQHFYWYQLGSTVLLVLAPLTPAQILVAQQRALLDGSSGATNRDYNQGLARLTPKESELTNQLKAQNYHIGPDDLLDISVFEVPDLSRTVRVSADGNVSLPLLGEVQVAGLSPSDVERSLEKLLRYTFMKEPHVGVFLREIQSHPVAVLGAVRKPGVFQIRESKSLVEVLSMSEGLTDDAGDAVVIMRRSDLQARTADGYPLQAGVGPSFAGAMPEGPRLTGGDNIATGGVTEISLKKLLESGDPRYNVMVNPGDVVKVTRAGVIYVVGEVKKPGGFTLKTNENISVLQALALAEGLTRMSAKARARIIRTDEGTGTRTEIPIDLGKILAGKAADPELRPKDIVFVPNSTGRSALYRGSEAALSIAGGLIVYRR